MQTTAKDLEMAIPIYIISVPLVCQCKNSDHKITNENKFKLNKLTSYEKQNTKSLNSMLAI